MSTNRELPDETEKKNDFVPEPEQESAGQDLSRVSDLSGSRTLADAFRDSYQKMHSEIYTGIYKPVGFYSPGRTPESMKPPADFPNLDLQDGTNNEAGAGGKQKPAAEKAQENQKKEEKTQENDSKKKDSFLNRFLWTNFSNFPKAENTTNPDTIKDGPPPKLNPGTRPGSIDFDPQGPDNPKLPPEPETKDSSLKPGERPEPKPENKPEPLPGPDKIIDSGNVRKEGNKVHVDYPGGQKTREITFAADGRAEQIITKDGSGSMHLVRKGEQWFARVQGMELQMPGKIEANDRGEVTFEMGQGIYRREKPDGSSVQEKTSEDGSRMSFYNNNQIEKLTRKDGSAVEISADGKKIIETLPGAARSIGWTKGENGVWTSDQNPAQQRKNYKVESNGNTSWDGPDGLKFVISGDGALMIQGEGQAKIQLDELNRIKSIDYGNKSREFEYFENSSEIKKTVISDKDKNTTSSFTREAAGSDRWKTDNGRTWTGDIKVGSGGVYSYKPSGSSIGQQDKDGRWYTMWPDGKVTRDQISEDGSRLSYDGDKLSKALAKDGTSADITDNKISINNPRTGESVSWTRDGDGWTADSARFPGVKKDLQINEKCEVSFLSDDGSRHSIRPDGKEVITRNDGVKLELNEKQQIDRITKGDSQRSIERAPDGSISRVTDKYKDSERLLVNRRKGDGVSSVEINKDGEITVKHQDQTSTLERANFTSVTRDRDGLPLLQTNQKGDSRSFKYEGSGPNKSLVEIQDTKKSSKGDRIETWTRKPGSNDFVSVNDKGKERTRENVKLCPDGSGDYTYKNKDGGNDRTSRLGADSGDSALSESVEEAREGLLDELREKLPEVNYKRFEEMMKGFEKRMGDRAYLRKLAGVKNPEAIDDEVTKDVQSTYDNLRQMVTKGDEGTFFDQKTRVKLAENFMFHAMEPTTVDQGPASRSDWNGHGTCWIETGQIWGLTQHPGAMADYLRQVSLDGQVVTRNSGEKDSTPKTYTFSSKLLSFTGNKQESKWTIETASTEWRDEGNMKTQIWGDRSPVSKIFDYTLPILSGSRKEFDVDGGTYGTHNFVGQGHTRGVKEIMLMVTGDYPVDRSFQDHSEGHLLDNNYAKSMLEKGTVLSYTPGHLRSQTIRQVDGKWYLYQDDQHSEKSDSVMAEITDIERWAKGDKSVERKVSISALDLLHKRAWTGSGSADAIGTVVPRSVNSNSSQSMSSYSSFGNKQTATVSKAYR